ncbi:MAG: hypothetical protein PHQ57_00965 [Candidatus Omnitrophica bacterium]|nr:hypothetical protein [Candidatus Omnitrophota bacterium]
MTGSTLSLWVVVLVIMVQFFGMPLLFGEDISDQPIFTVQGMVNQVDWVKQVLIVYNSGDEMSIFIPDGTPIHRGANDITLADINMGDPVTIRYYNATPGPLKAVSVSDNNLGNR